MKKTIAIVAVFSAVVISLPLLGSLLGFLGCTFKIKHREVFVIITALLPLALVVLNILDKRQKCGKALEVLYSLLPPLSVLNAFYHIWSTWKSTYSTALMFIAAFICVVSCSYLAIKYGRPILKEILIGVAATMIIVLAGLGSFMHLFRAITDDLNYQTVIHTVESPDGKYVAEIIESDHGALGGGTLVNVRTKKPYLNTLFFKVSKKAETVYRGEWGERPIIYWKNENCVTVNSIEHQID